MAAKTKDREKNELVAGLITMGVAILLLAFAVIFMTRCSSSDAPSTDPSDITTDSTESTESTLPALETNPYSAGDFSYNNGYLTCKAGKSMLGVDVSSHQSIIDWAQVAATDVEFAMIRIGYRGYEVGNICQDSLWQDNYQGAVENGLLVGTYFFSQAISVEEAVEEAEFVLEQLDGAALDLPIVFDWEPVSDTARTANMTASLLNECAVAFCDTIRQAGYTPMVYFNIALSFDLLDLQQMQQQGYDFWLAMYSDRMTFPYKIEMWQYSDGGSVSGINGNVDLNLYFIYDE